MKLYKYALVGLGLAVAITNFAKPATARYHQINKFVIGGEGGWDYLTFDSEGKRLFITRGNRVSVMDEKGVVVAEIPSTPGVHGVALAQDLHKGFTSNGGENTVTVFDLKSLKEIQRISVGKRPDAIIYDPHSKRIFTFNAGSQDATAVDAVTGKVVGTITFNAKPEFAVADGKGKIFVNLENKSEIAAFDSTTLKPRGEWSLDPGEEPSGLAIDRDAHRLFSVCANQNMIVMDSQHGRFVQALPIGKGPDAAAFDPKEHLVFSSNGQDGTLTVIREESFDEFTVMENIKTEPGARTMALDPNTHKIYLVTAQIAPPAPGTPAPKPGERRRPNFVPGSFMVLVFGN
jgi:DNA-binding beta-propeller fold protein YncE